MPLIGISCAKHGDVTFKDALAGKCDCYPRFFLDTIFETAKKDYHKGKIITATSLIGCLRETYLQRVYNYYAPLSQMYYSWRGTFIHDIFHRPNLEGWISEKIYTKNIATHDNQVVAISGKVDGYDIPTLTLWDIKTIGDNGLLYVVKGGAKDEHKPQVNIYRWLCPFEIKRLRIIYLTMMSFAKTGQINEIIQKLKKDPDKKKLKYEYFVAPTNRAPSGYGAYKVSYTTPEIEIWSDSQVLDFIMPRTEILLAAFNKEILPPMCDPDMQEWKCASYCNVSHICKKLEKEYENAT